MALDLNSLVKLLDQKVSAIQQLIEISRSEQVAIINNRAAELHEFTNQKTQTLLKIETLEKKKLNLFDQFCKEQKFKERIISTEQIVEFLHGKHKLLIQTYIKKIKALLLELKAINTNNDRLIGYSVRFINCMVNNLIPNSKTGCTYSQTGAYTKSGRRTSFEYCR